MIPRIAKQGTSFKGAGLYYLHDKKALTNDRVAFTQTQNLPTDDPEMAMKVMAYTAMCHKEIKQAAGSASSKRKIQTTVYSYSLSWNPSEKKSVQFNISAGNIDPTPAPTFEEMIKAGLETLKSLGLHEHESVIVGHNDTSHPHIHVIVNRVHPETGIVNTHSFAKRKLSRWAENYEREQGQILCKKRVENNERRRNGEYVKYKEDLKKAEYYRWQRERTNQAITQRQKDAKVLEELQKQQRDELLNGKENLIKDEIARIKELNRSGWASIYRQQEQENSNFQEIQRNALSRLITYIKNRKQDREHGTLDAKRGILSGAYNAITNGHELENTLNKKHEHERKVFAEKIAEQTRSSVEHINDNYSRYLEGLKANQFIEQQLMKERHSEESQRRAADIASGKTKEEFDRHNKMKESFRRSQEPQNDNIPPKTKENFTRSATGHGEKEDKEFKFVNDNFAKETKDQKKDTEIKEEFNFVKDNFAKNKEEEKKSDRFTDRGTNKGSGMGRDI